MVDVIKEKERLTHDLTDQYSKSIISLEEYEGKIDMVNKVDSVKELKAVQKICGIVDPMLLENSEEEQLTIFSWRSTNVKPVNGNAGKFVCVFGTNRITINDMPKGKTVLHVESIFGLTEILIPKNVRVINRATPIISGIFFTDETEREDDAPELYITGTAVFGNITIIRT